VRRVLLLTSHPLDPPWDSADKGIAAAISRLMEGYRFVAFGRIGAPHGGAHARVPIVSRNGRSTPGVRTQIAALSPFVEPSCDLMHAVLSIGPRFRMMSRFRSHVPRILKRPVIHTVPGVIDPSHLDGAVPLGITIAASEATADLLRSSGFDDVRVVPPGIPLERWPARPRAQDRNVVLFAGHFGDGGGAEEAIRGTAEAVRLGAHVRLILAMRSHARRDVDGRRADLLRLASSQGLTDVRIIGHVPDMRPLVAEASLVLMPVITLAGKADIPLIVLEAMASGRPVIASDLPYFAAVRDAVNTVRAGDPVALGAEIARLLQSHADWQRSADAGRLIVERSFSDRAMVSVYAELYDELMSRA